MEEPLSAFMNAFSQFKLGFVAVVITAVVFYNG
jgi:hypothetical protein